mmetsp:Transcript_25925/g.25650  ORF Transcript_25925/g.25650 Transcript_25925/m.25650 type:complete len:177 (-) Transcript_25925:52-582(-)
MTNLATMNRLKSILNTDTDRVEHYLMPQNASTAVLAFTNFMNAFAVTTVVPTLVDNMQKPKQFPRVLVAGFFVIVAIFAAIAYSGYAGFGHDLLDYPNITYAIAYGNITHTNMTHHQIRSSWGTNSYIPSPTRMTSREHTRSPAFPLESVILVPTPLRLAVVPTVRPTSVPSSTSL